VAVRSKRLTDSITCNAGTTTNVFTVPSGRTAIVRSIAVNSSAATGATVAFLLDTGAGAVNFQRAIAIPAAGSILYTGPLVFNPGDVFSVNVATTNCRVMLFGTLLLGEPE